MMIIMSEIFSCGSEAGDWINRNCEKCNKFDLENINTTFCRMGVIIMDGFVGCEGPTIKQLSEYGYKDNLDFTCTQIEVKP